MPHSFRSAGPALAVAALMVAAAGLTAPAHAASPNASPIEYQVHPIAKFAVGSVTPGDFPTPSACVAAFGLACYTPSEMRSAYDVPANLTGAGQTIVIVDAFGSPTIRQDLAAFDTLFGLPAPTLNIFYPEGKPTYDPHARHGLQVGWAEETSLDVEWSHAIAPAATIDLVVAPTPYGNALNNAEAFAVDHHLGQVMSMSFGAPEAAIAGRGNNLQLLQAHRVYEDAA